MVSSSHLAVSCSTVSPGRPSFRHFRPISCGGKTSPESTNGWRAPKWCLFNRLSESKQLLIYRFLWMNTFKSCQDQLKVICANSFCKTTRTKKSCMHKRMYDVGLIFLFVSVVCLCSRRFTGCCVVSFCHCYCWSCTNMSCYLVFLPRQRCWGGMLWDWTQVRATVLWQRWLRLKIWPLLVCMLDYQII